MVHRDDHDLALEHREHDSVAETIQQEAPHVSVLRVHPDTCLGKAGGVADALSQVSDERSTKLRVDIALKLRRVRGLEPRFLQPARAHQRFTISSSSRMTSSWS